MTQPTRTTFVRLLLLLPVLLVSCGDDAPDTDDSDETSLGGLDEIWDVDEGIGPLHVYDMTTTITQTATVNGEEYPSDIVGSGQMRMRMVDSNADRNIFVAVVDFAMSGETAGQEIPVVRNSERMRYVTAKNGTVVEMAMKSSDPDLDRTMQKLLQSVNERQNAANIFMRRSWLDKEVGESWVETISDTIAADSVAMQGTPVVGNFAMIFEIRTQYTYEGTVDTLGVKAARIRSQVLTFDINGTIDAEDVGVEITSTGTGSYLSYFDTSDLLVLAMSGSQKLSSTVSIAALGMVMPMDQTISMTMQKRAAGATDGGDAAATTSNENEDTTGAGIE